MGTFIDLSGKTFGRLTVTRRAENHKRQTVWECLCSCGKKVNVQGGHLRGGKIISCGCYQRENNKRKATIHGHWGQRLHGIWLAMRQRCNNPKCRDYKNYGGRGIKVCTDWDVFSIFEKWALENGYQDVLTIERLEVNGDYCPENCTWIPKSEQGKNTRKTVKSKKEGT